MRLSSIAGAQGSAKGKPVLAPLAKTFTYPALTGGWNAKDPLTGMEPTDAVMLENYFPSTANIALRNGCSSFATGLGASSAVETLMTYNSGATSKLFGICGGKIYDTSSAGAVGAAAVTGLTNSRWQHVNFTVSGGAYLVLVNGTDSLLEYNGSAWTAITGVSVPAITGVTTSTLIGVFAFKKRLFFIQKNTLSVWYLDVDSIAGTATEFSLAPQFKKGGYIVAGGSLTRDGGDGMDDLFVVITNNGEVVIYSGTDPGSDFALIGRYDIGSPLGRRCLMKFGSDLAVMTIDGIVPLSQVLSIDVSSQPYAALSDRVRNAWGPDAVAYKANFGWEGISYPAGQRLLFNMPITENALQYQYVQNAITGAWCKFTGYNANCFALYDDHLYFGGNSGTIYKADTTSSDNGSQIVGQIQTAFSYLDGTQRTKDIGLIKPNFISSPGFTFGAAVIVDFSSSYTLNYFTPLPGAGTSSYWDLAEWDESYWDSTVPIKSWVTASGKGAAISLILKTQSDQIAITLADTAVLYTPGGVQ